MSDNAPKHKVTKEKDYLIPQINRSGLNTERDKWGFDCNKQSVERSSNSPQSRAKGSEGRITERGDKKD